MIKPKHSTEPGTGQSSRADWSRAIVCLCLSVSDFDRYSLTIARWLTTFTT